MPRNDTAIYALTEVILEAVALGQAMLDGDITEARFRATSIVSHTESRRQEGIRDAAIEVLEYLGASGMSPKVGYGSAIDRLSQEIDKATDHTMH